MHSPLLSPPLLNVGMCKGGINTINGVYSVVELTQYAKFNT